MNAVQNKREELPHDLLAEAGVWVVRLHGPNRTPEAEAGFRQWLRADDKHARAFELVTEVWDDSRNLPRVAHVPRVRAVRKPVAWAPLAAAAALAVAVLGGVLYGQRSTVDTRIGEQRLLTLEDGSRVFLNTATRLTLQYSGSERRIRLDAGEALFDVARDAARPFIVSAGARDIRALGTSFAVRRDERRLVVTLVDGKVAVTPPESADGQRLSPGERLTFVSETPPRLDRPVMAKAMAWRRGQVILDDTPLAEAVAEMNRYSRVTLSIDNPHSAGLLINGLFQAGDSMSFANAVAQTYGLRVVQGNGEIRLAGSPLRH